TPVKNEEGKYPSDYRAERAQPAPTLPRLLGFRSVHPVYGAFLVDARGKANWDERVQAFESVLEMPRPLLKFVRPKGVPPGLLEAEVLRPALEQRGLLAVKEEPTPDEDDQDRRW